MLRFWFEPVFLTFNTFDLSCWPLVMLWLFKNDVPISTENWFLPIVLPFAMGLIFGHLSRTGERALRRQRG